MPSCRRPVRNSCSSEMSASADITLMFRIEPHAAEKQPMPTMNATSSHVVFAGARSNRRSVTASDQKTLRPAAVATIVQRLSKRRCAADVSAKPR